jgi:hypothetical protein
VRRTAALLAVVAAAGLGAGAAAAPSPPPAVHANGVAEPHRAAPAPAAERAARGRARAAARAKGAKARARARARAKARARGKAMRLQRQRPVAFMLQGCVAGPPADGIIVVEPLRANRAMRRALGDAFEVRVKLGPKTKVVLRSSHEGTSEGSPAGQIADGDRVVVRWHAPRDTPASSLPAAVRVIGGGSSPECVPVGEDPFGDEPDPPVWLPEDEDDLTPWPDDEPPVP